MKTIKMCLPTAGVLAILLLIGNSRVGAAPLRGVGQPQVIPSPTIGADRDREKKPWLVFTSAGDHSAVAQWLPGRRYDVMVVYYGDGEYPYKDMVDIYRERRDCKFCNLKWMYKEEPEFMAKYTAVAVFDDDIQISADGLNRLFEIREKYDLWITTPSMKPQYHSFKKLASAEPGTRVRLVDFVEMDCPMFKAEKLSEFIADFDTSVKGWGTDLYYANFFGEDLLAHQAVADCVTAINPPTRQDTGKREILQYLGSDKVREREWLALAKRKGYKKIHPPPDSTIKGSADDLSWPCSR